LIRQWGNNGFAVVIGRRRETESVGVGKKWFEQQDKKYEKAELEESHVRWLAVASGVKAEELEEDLNVAEDLTSI